jgi:ribosome-binding protein aMBF1 (putative translation factor)
MDEKYEIMINSYKTWFPSLYEKTIKCTPRSKYSIVAELEDGTRMEFDGVHNTVRDVTCHYDPNQTVDEDAWRKEFGYRLREAMIDRGINQEMLSDLSGISRQMITRYVRGHSTPSAYTIDRLARILKCDVRDLTRFDCAEQY